MISGIAITLGADASRHESAREALTAMSGLTLGEQIGSRLAAVLEVATPQAADDAWERIQGVRDVMKVDCVCVLQGEEAELPANSGEA